MANVFILTHRLGGVAVFWLIPGGSVCLIPAAAVFLLIIHATEMKGGAGGVDGDLSPSAGGLIPDGVTVLKKYQGCSGSNPGRANCSREDSRWCSVTSNTRKGSSNPGLGTGGSWHDSRWCSVKSSSVYSRSPLFIAGGCLFTPATLRRRALGWPVNARRAVATAFALLTSRLGWRLVLLLSGFFFLQIQDCGRPGLAAKGSRLGQRGGVYREPSIWVCGVGQQRVHNSRPLSMSFRSLSKGTSHFVPRGQSREGFGGGLLRSR